jgi:DNA-binding response OmpR family regulator
MAELNRYERIMSELLLIDDDQELCELLVSWLAQEGFVAHACHDGRSARAALAEHQPSAVVLDVMLPDGSGLDLLKQLRSEHPDLPVLMLSGRGEPLDRILGLELGADDYLAKPCDPRELTARLKAVLRRSQPASAPTQLELGDLWYSPARGVASVGGHEVTLTLSEGRILEALLSQPGDPLEKQALAQLALGRKLTLYDRSLDMHVSNLRRKLGPHPDGRQRIVALRSRGYLYAS